jgi:tetratricopeptide (TPR) repeat protein
MASKEVMVSAPLVAFVYDGIFISGSFKESLRRRWRFWLALSATWLLLGTLVLLSQRRGDSAGFGLGMTAWQYAERQVGCVLHYLRLAFWPSPLVLDYGNATVRAPTRFVPAALGVFLLLAATVAALIFRPKLGFLAFCFFAILAPTSSIVPLAGQTEAEHRMYLPLAAVTTLVVLAGYRLAKRVTLPWWAAAVPVLGMAAALGGGTSQRNQVYRSELVLWDDTVRSWPINYRAYHNRANAYLAMGNFDAAIGDFKKEVELNPRDPRSYANLGDGYSAAGDFEQAIRSYDRAIRLKPTFARAYNGRGSCHGNLGNVEEALADFDRAIALDPTLAEAHYNSGNAFGSKGQIDHAIRDYGRAIELEPDYADAYNQRAAAYESQGNVAAALRDLDKAIELRPDNASAFYNRALVRFEAKAYDQARADVQAFQRLGGKPSAELTDALTRASGRSQ